MTERGLEEVSTVASVVLLSAEQMRAAEAAAIKGGMSSAALMEKAGAGVADIAMKGWSKRPAAVICGPGNNGGDGFVAARRLTEAGWPVKTFLIGDQEALKGDAKLMADLVGSQIAPFTAGALEGSGLIIDALFGTGLSRPLEGDVAAAVEAINKNSAPALSVDLPSGLDANTGAVLGAAVQSVRTVTFFAKKPAHVLFPGRAFCGAVDVVDIGMAPNALAEIKVDTFENQPPLWGGAFQRPFWRTHKYHRGHVFVMSGGRHETGAARLAAIGAQRIGAGLVTLLSSEDAADINAAHLTSIMLGVVNNGAEISERLSQKPNYFRVGVIGPAASVGETTKENTLAMLQSSSASVIDADALMSFAEDRETLFSRLRAVDMITPHEGEFARLFGEIGAEGRLAAARSAAARAGCVCVLKGADTIIAAPDGRAAVTINAPADLATAGSGDVLAGFVAGLAANGMPAFEAAASGVWFHGAAGQAVGPGLIADDLPNATPAVLRSLLTPPKGGGDGDGVRK